MQQHGPWVIKSTSHVYRDRFIEVRRDEVIRPDGEDGAHVVVHQKPGVSVLPIGDGNDVYLTKEFHYGVGRYSLEAVSGGVEPGEDADRTARRELREELGLRAERWHLLTTIDPFTTIVVSPTRLYLARGLIEARSRPEGTEQIERVQMPLEEAVREVFRGSITHAPTCVLLLMARQLQQDSG